VDADLQPPPRPPRPTDIELAILRVLWRRGPSTVRQVHDELSRREPAAYTTTLKQLQIMAEKGLVARDESQRAHLYAARHPETARVEYAPIDPHRSDPIARLTAQLQTTSETTLAIDVGDESASGALLADAQREHREAAAQRRAAEASRGHWLPGRRRELERLRHTETQLARRVQQPRRQQAEQRHGARPFVDDRDDDMQYRDLARLIAERRLERETGRTAEITRGRGLGR